MMQDVLEGLVLVRGDVFVNKEGRIPLVALWWLFTAMN